MSEPHLVEAVVRQVAAELERRLASPLAPGLYLVATPIGNMADITLRAIAVLARAGSVYCEDTRQSSKILQRYAIRARLDTYHEHNADRVRPRILEALAGGGSVALMSDAGTPLISDPGFKLVRAAADGGHAVWAIPGASAVLAGLVAAGLPTDSFHFAGFLPSKSGARRSRIAALAAVPGTLVLFEAPGRTADLMADLAAGLGDRPAAIARELTKLNETILRGPLSTLAQNPALAGLRGEVVVLIGGGEAKSASDEEIIAALEPALAGGSLRDATAAVALALGAPRNRVYELAIAIRDGKVDSEDKT